jgi:hypothetical protein
MVDPKEKQAVAATREKEEVRSETIENAHASGDGSLEKSDDRLEELNEQDEPEDPPY